MGSHCVRTSRKDRQRDQELVEHSSEEAIAPMGIDPQTQEPSSTLSGSQKIFLASPSTRHMAQWEGARLEAEGRVSKGSLLSNIPPSFRKSEADFFLRLWNSDVGETFHMFDNGGKIVSPIIVSSPSTGNHFRSWDFAANFPEKYHETEGKSCNEEVWQRSDHSTSNELEDSSESALQLLLNFPSNNDTTFLEHTDSYNLYPANF